MRYRILVVDDESDIARALCYILELHRYISAWATTGTEAVARAKIYHPDLLVSDIVMPGLNGFETGMQIEQHCPECRLVFVTGLSPNLAREYNLMSAFEKRGYTFNLLMKPVHPDILLESVRAALLKHP